MATNVGGRDYGFTMRSQRYELIKAVLVIVIGTLLNIYAFYFIRFQDLPVSRYWQITIERALSSLLTLIEIWWLYPDVMKRLTLRINRKRLLVALLILAYLSLPSIIRSGINNYPIFSIIEGLSFALAIGVDEDFFSRGLIFASLERYGIQVAAIISSIHFGLLHLGNVIWGGQSLSYTLTQVCSAASFGYLAVGIMLFTRSIWIPIVMHGLFDTPMQFEGIEKFTKEVTGKGDWIGTLFELVLYCGIGYLLIIWSNELRRERLMAFLRKHDLLFEKRGEKKEVLS